MKVAVLASGKGSNVENLLSYFKNNSNIQVVLIGANNNNSGAIEHAKNYNVTNFIFSKKELESTSVLLKTLEKHKVGVTYNHHEESAALAASSSTTPA